MKDETPLVLRDSKDLKNVLVQVNLKKGTTAVLSNFTAWDNLAFLMEGLGATAAKCIDEGMDKQKVRETIENCLEKVLGSYQIFQ